MLWMGIPVLGFSYPFGLRLDDGLIDSLIVAFYGGWWNAGPGRAGTKNHGSTPLSRLLPLYFY